MKKTKIICSIGPASRKYDVMKSMVENGMNVARINFSHATEIEMKETVDLVHKINKELKTNIGILYDTKGPDFRTGKVKEDIILKEGNTIKLVKDDIIGTSEAITVNYKDALDKINIDDIILLEDDMNVICEMVKQFYYMEDKSHCKLVTDFYDEEIYSHVSMPDTVELVKYFESCGHQVDHEITFNETLKAIYRGV